MNYVQLMFDDYDILHNPEVRKKYPILYAEVAKSCEQKLDSSYFLSHKAYEEYLQYINDINIEYIGDPKDFNVMYLDTLDLSGYLPQSSDVQTIMTLIQEDYDNNDELPDELEGCVFNFLDAEDVAYYLANRYKLNVHEEVIVHYVLT